jgi:hypothetical protein
MNPRKKSKGKAQSKEKPRRIKSKSVRVSSDKKKLELLHAVS